MKRLVGDVRASVHIDGVSRRGPLPDADGWHEDEFFRMLGPSLWFPMDALPGVPDLPDGLRLRVGGGLGLSNLQRLRVTPQLTEETMYLRSEKGAAVVIGPSFHHPITSRASLGMDLSWTRFWFSEGPEDVSVIAAAFGFKWHP